MKILKIRDVKLPDRGTDKSSGVDFYIPNDVTELYNASNCKYTPSEFISEEQQKEMKGNNFLFESDMPYINIPSGYGILIPSGIKIELGSATSDKVYDLVFADKSGISTKLGLIIGAKVVDADYKGEIHIHLINTTKFNIPVYPGQKIVQGIIRQVEITPIIEVEADQIHLGTSQRGEGGFGSTNK